MYINILQTGALIDHVLFSHAAGPALREKAKAAGSNIYVALNTLLQHTAEQYPHVRYVTRTSLVFA